MKKVLCALLACVLCSSVAIGFSGCGCSNNQEPGYRIEETKPDLEDGGFGFFVINNDQLMLTKYTGSEKDVKIPESFKNYQVTCIGSNVFSDTDITSVVIPDSVTEIQDYAFYGCTKLKSVTFSKKLEKLGTNVFNLCTALESVELPASIKDFGMYTFTASGLKSVTIPESTTFTSIGHFVFYQCQNLTEVTIPATITAMEEDAISECPNPITIKAPKGSYAENYASKNKFKFVETK